MNPNSKTEAIKTLIRRVDNRPEMYMKALAGQSVTDENWTAPKQKPDSNFIDAIKEMCVENPEAVAETLAHFHSLATHYKELVERLEMEVGIKPDTDYIDGNAISAHGYTGQLRSRWWEAIEHIDTSQLQDLFKTLDPFQMIARLLRKAEDNIGTDLYTCVIYSDGSGQWADTDGDEISEFVRSEDALDAYLNWDL